jgi:hypothetical protein
MKRSHLYLILSTGAALLIPAALSFSGGTELKEKEAAVVATVDEGATESIPVPDQVWFGGQRIELDRLDMRERFDREINAFAYQHSTTLLYIKRANRYFPIIEPILKQEAVPDDFKYLCVVESGLDLRAVSPSQAAGLWQFMEPTARKYGLEIRDGVDERYHIEKATEAACRYFRDAYRLYGDWISVAAAYNAGMGRISAFRRQQGAESAFDLWMTVETSRYLFRILAVKEVFRDPSRYGFRLKKEDLYPPVAVNWVEAKETIPGLPDFARQNGLNYMQLKDYNMWLRDTLLTIPKAGTKVYRIAIPKAEDLYFDRKRIRVHDRAWVKE